MNEYKTMSIMLDCSRNAVPNINFLKKFISSMADFGYNQLQLYIEDIYEVENEPYFGYMRGRYTKDEIKEIDEFAKSKGIELVPAIQLLAHLGTIFRYIKYQGLRDDKDVICPDLDETYVVLENCIKSIREMFSTDTINIGMDETEALGMGQHLKKYGFENSKSIYLRHLNKVNEILIKYNFKPMMWGDMFIKLDNDGRYYNEVVKVSEDTKKLKPDNIQLIYWDYYNLNKKLIKGMIEGFKNFDNNVVWAGGAWSWIGFGPQNEFSEHEFRAMFPEMKKNGVDSYILTMWGDNGGECSRYALLPTIFMFSEMVKGNFNIKDIKNKFFEYTKIKYHEYELLDAINNPLNEKEKEWRNPCKYMLYDDPFMGFFESTTLKEGKETYHKLANKYKKYSSSSEYGYVFNTMSKLAKVLEYKYYLTHETRVFYEASDKNKMKEVVLSYKKCIKALDEFYLAFKTQWHIENKSFGFEVQTARIGGLRQRLLDCVDELNDWIRGKISNIEMLDVKHLPFDDSVEGIIKNNKSISFNSYQDSISVCNK